MHFPLGVTTLFVSSHLSGKTGLRNDLPMLCVECVVNLTPSVTVSMHISVRAACLRERACRDVGNSDRCDMPVMGSLLLVVTIWFIACHMYSVFKRFTLR